MPRPSPRARVLASRLGLLVAAALATAIFGIVGGIQAATYLSGTAVTVHVDRCEIDRAHSRRHLDPVTVCHGSWTGADGATHVADVPHADGSDRGRDVRLRARDGRLVPDGPRSLLLLGVAVPTLGLTVVAAIAVRRALRDTSRQRGRPDSAAPTG